MHGRGSACNGLGSDYVTEVLARGEALDLVESPIASDCGSGETRGEAVHRSDSLTRGQAASLTRAQVRHTSGVMSVGGGRERSTSERDALGGVRVAWRKDGTAWPKFGLGERSSQPSNQRK